MSISVNIRRMTMCSANDIHHWSQVSRSPKSKKKKETSNHPDWSGLPAKAVRRWRRNISAAVLESRLGVFVTKASLTSDRRSHDVSTPT